MTAGSISLAAVLDPYRLSKNILHLPVGFGAVALEEDPGAAVIDVCLILVTNLVVAVYCNLARPAHRAGTGAVQRKVSPVHPPENHSIRGLIVRPDEITYPVDRLAIYPAKRASFPYHRITARETTSISGSTGLRVYTDSSYAEGLTRAAYVVFDRANRVEAVGRFSVSRATSAFCSEAMALAEALTWLKAHPLSQDVFVYMDCLSLLQAISSRMNTV
ncbi:hypothetical protein MRX96_035374 [Rhipicephalus microplus]